MDMKHTTLTLDDEMVQKAKEKGINISKFVRESLAKALEVGDIDKINKTLELFDNLQTEMDEARKTIEEHKNALMESLNARKEEVMKKCKDVPELHNLSPSFLKDTKQMMGLVDIIRAKYPESRISIADIKEYYELK